LLFDLVTAAHAVSGPFKPTAYCVRGSEKPDTTNQILNEVMPGQGETGVWGNYDDLPATTGLRNVGKTPDMGFLHPIRKLANLGRVLFASAQAASLRQTPPCQLVRKEAWDGIVGSGCPS
jgi:hypothetical protein